jgi:dolichyl-phosphate-mannose--protein O-mannosyl transferase
MALRSTRGGRRRGQRPPVSATLTRRPLPSRYKREHGIELETHFSHYFCVVTFCVAAYFLNLLPYLGVKRSAFIYHYMPALMYAEILAALTMDRLFGAFHVNTLLRGGARSLTRPLLQQRVPRLHVRDQPGTASSARPTAWLFAGPKYMPIAARLFLLTMVAGFAYFMPWIYALPLSQEAHNQRRWLKRWD